MAVMRSMLLAASQSKWLREHATQYRFVRRSVDRFMPGESLDDALAAARALQDKKISAVLTQLGENIKEASEAQTVAAHYVEVLDRIHRSGLHAEVSVKLTQLGLDLSPDLCFENLKAIAAREKNDSTVWIDMESSPYVDATLGVYRRALAAFPNVGVCLQAYLFQTKDDLASLLPLRPSIRLVKGAYAEPAHVAYPRKRDVDENYFLLAQELLRALKENRCARAAFATHDTGLIRRIFDFASREGFSEKELEVQMLYGIQRAEQERIAGEGHPMNVLISYGSYWYPWFVRRLAERPANVWFILRNLFAG